MKGLEKLRIDRIDPVDWFVGMKNPQLQLMVYGEGIREVQEVTTDYPNVVIEEIVRLDSPNYLLVYLNLKDVCPGTMTLVFKGEKKLSEKIDYVLKPRKMDGNKRVGFDVGDVLYLLLPDRFAQGNGHKPQVKGLMPYCEDRRKPSLRHGGDLNGIREHLDYFEELGVTTIWITPVLENNAPDDPRGFSTYHGYAITDYYRVDPRLGSNNDYCHLVNEAHERGLKVVMDMIFNHCGIHHPWAGDPPSSDWFNRDVDSPTGHRKTSYKLTPVLDPYASEFDRRQTVEGWFIDDMPDLNQHNSHLMRYLIQNSFWWIETVGVDGIRMDTYPYAFADAMADWMKELNQEYPHFNVVGETWVAEPAYSAAWQADSSISEVNSHLKTVMDFSFYDKINQAKNEETDDWWQGLNRVYHSFVYDYLYPNPSSVLAFIDNHDTNRFLAKGRDVDSLKQALALLLTVNRIPQIYYGTEILMNGVTEKSDGNVRKDFPGGFPGDQRSAFSEKGRSRAQQHMFLWLSRLLNFRKTEGRNCITKGRQVQFIPYNGIYVVARLSQSHTVLTILNGTNHSQMFAVKRYSEVIRDAKTAKDIPTGRQWKLTTDFLLKPRQSLVLYI